VTSFSQSAMHCKLWHYQTDECLVDHLYTIPVYNGLDIWRKWTLSSDL